MHPIFKKKRGKKKDSKARMRRLYLIYQGGFQKEISLSDPVLDLCVQFRTRDVVMSVFEVEMLLLRPLH